MNVHTEPSRSVSHGSILKIVTFSIGKTLATIFIEMNNSNDMPCILIAKSILYEQICIFKQNCMQEFAADNCKHAREC